MPDTIYIDPDENELVETCMRWREAGDEDNDALLSHIAELQITPGNLAQATEAIGRLITVEAKPPKAVRVGKNTPWEQRARAARFNIRQIMRQWVRFPDLMTMYVVHLYNIDHGRTRDMVDYLLGIKPPPPYLKSLLFHVIQDVFQLSAEDMTELKRKKNWQPRLAYLNQLFETDALQTWVESQSKHVRYFSGLTNTIVGFYDGILCDPNTGVAHVPNDAGINLDLGGGYGTPDIARMFGLEFTSLDLNSPYDAEESAIRFRVADKQSRATRFQSSAERADYLQRLQATPWRKFDVFRDHIAQDHESYFITSFGFLSSTVRSLSDHIPKLRGTKAKQFYATTYMGLWKLLELVAAGKRVDLFTYQRALARCYRNRTIMLSFRDQRLVGSYVTVDPRFDINGDKFQKLQQRCEQVASHFKGMTSMEPREKMISEGAPIGAQPSASKI